MGSGGGGGGGGGGMEQLIDFDQSWMRAGSGSYHHPHPLYSQYAPPSDQHVPTHLNHPHPHQGYNSHQLHHHQQQQQPQDFYGTLGGEGHEDDADQTASTIMGDRDNGGGEATEVFGGAAVYRGGTGPSRSLASTASGSGYQPTGGGGGGGKHFPLRAVDEMLTWNGGRLEDATPVESPTVLPKRREY